ncbi:hypothetical protein QQF64_001154 [Cirrhinus molitorella]|uniref:SCAN box domain-containing protein n=1 Tax=Cirrhinus molitorella TaxID=172907 RepID=A0ABR3P0M1_9TELE
MQFGRVDEYKESKEDFESYIERFEQWLLANDIARKTPAELFLKRQIRTRFSLLKPDLAKSIQEKQQKQKEQHDQGRRVLRSFVEEEPVRVRNFRGGQEKWLSATVIEKKGPVSYLVQEGQRRRTVHVDHMLPRKSAEGSPMHGMLEIPSSSVTDDNRGPLIFPTISDCSTPVVELESPENTETVAVQDLRSATHAVETVRRYPQRIRTAPKRLDL